MSSLKDILSNFYFEPVNENKYPKFGKAGKQDYQFICKRCGNSSEPMKFDLDIQYRLGVHLTRYCKPPASDQQQQQEEAINEQ